MTRISKFGTSWLDYDSEVVGELTEKTALKRLNSGRPIALEIEPGVCARGYVVHAPATDYVLIGLLGWPSHSSDKASLHFQGTVDGAMRLVQIEVTHGKAGSEAKPGTSAWTQIVYLFDQGRRATFDDLSAQTRVVVDLTSSATHSEVSLLRFEKPAFSDYDHLIRPDLVERCLLDPTAFTPDNPTAFKVYGEGIYALDEPPEETKDGNPAP